MNISELNNSFSLGDSDSGIHYIFLQIYNKCLTNLRRA